MSHQWETYKRRGAGGRASLPFVSVHPRGPVAKSSWSMHLSSDTYKALGMPTHVALLFDITDGVLLGIRGALPEDPNAVTVSKSRNVGATAFVRQFDLKPQCRYTVTVQDGVAIFRPDPSLGPLNV